MILSKEEGTRLFLGRTKRAEADVDAVCDGLKRCSKGSCSKLLIEFLRSIDLYEIMTEVMRAHKAHKEKKGSRGGNLIVPGLEAIRTKYGYYIFLQIKEGMLDSGVITVLRIIDGREPYMVINKKFIEDHLLIMDNAPEAL